MTEGGPGSPQEMIKGPATGLMVVGGIGIPLCLLSMAMNALAIVNAGQFQGQMRDQLMMQAIGGIVGAVIGLAVSAFIIFGAMKMKNLENKSLAMVAAIIAMIPCGGCCIIGLPIGIWALMTMNKPEFEGAWQG